MFAHAYVNHGRWLIDCPQCNAGWIVRSDMLTSLFGTDGIPHAACVECGWTGSVQFPPEMDAIDEILSLRPEKKNRNWRLGETIADLRIENAAHGATQ